jgi:hypothetical protein
MSKRRNLERRAKAKAVKLLKAMTPEERQQAIDKINANANANARP